MSQQSSERVPKQMQAKFEAIVSLTDTFCEKHLNEEYAQLCRKLAAALSRKRLSPLATGKVNTWVCGIVNALGMVNFLAVAIATLQGLKAGSEEAKILWLVDHF